MKRRRESLRLNEKLHAFTLIVAVSCIAQFTATDTFAASSNPALIDDSATVVLDGTPSMNWRSITPKSRDNAIVGRTRVNVKLATAPWLGKTARIYMVLPAESTGSAKISWRSHGLLLDGELAPGRRTLVYSGTIREKRMEDVLEVQIEADGVRLSSVQQLRFHFEIDVE
ncbi:MAG: hypothetical protein ABI583_07310 [Betaproteobacteria bacterium]